MPNLNDMPIFELNYVIVNYGLGSKVLRKAKQHGVFDGTVFQGRGTVSSGLAKFLSLYDERKEIVLFGTDRKTAEHALVELNKEFQFEKPHHGIVFTISACSIIGTETYKCEKSEEGRGENKSMYQIIMAIVNRGMAEEVIEAAEAAGSKGGTIMNARGAGVRETKKVFNIEIEPEKEMVMILSKKDITEKIVSSIREKLEIDKPGNGIIFVQDVNKTYGIYE